MSRKIIILVVLICVILLGVGLSALNEYREYQKGGDIFGADDFTIQISNDEKIIKNEEVGLSFKVPADWQTGTFVGGALAIISSDYQTRTGDIFPEKGCLFTASAFTYGKYEINGALDVQENIQRLLKTEEELEKLGMEEVIIVDESQAYKTRQGIDRKIGEGEETEYGGYIKVEIPNIPRSAKYELNAFLFGDDIERCQKEFDQILATVKIK